MGPLAALTTGIAVFAILVPSRGPSLSSVIGRYLRPFSEATPDNRETDETILAAERAGVPWTATELQTRRIVHAGVGILAGLLLAQGDLLLSGARRSAPALAVLGALGGIVVFSMRLTGMRQRRAEILVLELPVIADAIALRVIAGDSIPLALEYLAMHSDGVAATELRRALERYRGGSGLAEALATAASRTVDPAAARLYNLLGQVHLTGGRLAEALADLAVDYRAATSRRLTTEQGRRAVATYGPILALMVPVTLLFLMYPTLAGLRELAGGP